MLPQRLVDRLKRELHRVKDLDFHEYVPLRGRTTFRIGGNARIFLLPKTPEALKIVLNTLSDHKISYHVLGGGSNVLIADHGLECVVDVGSLKWIRELDERTIEVGAGIRLKQLLPYVIKKGFSGVEFLSGIPGTLGGAVTMNAGANWASMADVVKEVLIVAPYEMRWWSREEMGFGYRTSRVIQRKDVLVAGARLTLRRSTPEKIREQIKATMKLRYKRQPLGRKSAGCIFKNPEECPAGALIEASGLKGYNVGDAYISKRHANFILNRKNARAMDVVELIWKVQEKVFEDHGVKLEPEIKGLGVRL